MPFSKKEREAVEQLREMWYGETGAMEERAARVPLRKADEVFTAYLPKIIGKTFGELMQIQTLWPDIVGKNNALRSNPVFYKDQELVIEVSHPAFKMALDTPTIRNLIMERIPALTGLVCTNIRFVPPGSRKDSKFAR